MTINAQEAQQLLESIAVHQAADGARHGLNHASRIARLPVDSWEAGVLARADSVRKAGNPPELRALMADQSVPYVFLPKSAMVTSEIIDRICAESSFGKMIIWETND